MVSAKGKAQQYLLGNSPHCTTKVIQKTEYYSKTLWYRSTRTCFFLSQTYYNWQSHITSFTLMPEFVSFEVTSTCCEWIAESWMQWSDSEQHFVNVFRIWTTYVWQWLHVNISSPSGNPLMWVRLLFLFTHEKLHLQRKLCKGKHRFFVVKKKRVMLFMRESKFMQICPV